MSDPTPKPKVEYITPESASDYLEKNNGNRDLSSSHVREYQQMMSKGEWMLAPDAIAFDQDGNLINGQHRLHAIIESDTTQPFLIVRGLSPRVFEVADQGRRRNLGQALGLDGFSNARDLSALGKRVFNFEKGTSMDRKVTTVEGLDFIKHHMPEISDAITKTQSLRNEAKGLWRPACYRFVYFTMMWRNEKKAWEFIEGVATGVGFSSKDDPRRRLRERLQKEARAPGGRIDRKLEQALSVKACNKWFEGETPKFIRWSPGADEDFPQPKVGENYPFGYFG